MTKNEKLELCNKLDSESATNLLKIQSEPYSQKAYAAYDANTILSMFINATEYNRRKNLNLALDKKFINSLATPETSPLKLFSFIKMIINDDKLDKLQNSLLLLDGK
jgi:hypothetical protein